MKHLHREHPASRGFPTLILCKPSYEGALRQEIVAKVSATKTSAAGGRPVGPGGPVGAGGRGWLLLPTDEVPQAAYIFERQRMPQAELAPGPASADQLRDWVETRLPTSTEKPPLVQVFLADPAGAGRRVRLARMLADKLGALCESSTQQYSTSHQCSPSPSQVMQVCVTEQEVWCSLAPARVLTNPFPGGISTVLTDPRAPSRSATKVEEALTRMGEPPRAGQTVVDLGAAPGGWSWQFLRHHCRVVAVDRGPLKLRDAEALGGQLTHLKQDGLRYQPQQTVDWLLSDMLIPPGVALGLLRKWIGRRWMRRFVMNIKLPQENPYAALAPLESYLQQVLPGAAQLRQLWHDRREVTVWGQLADTAGAKPRQAAQVNSQFNSQRSSHLNSQAKTKRRSGRQLRAGSTRQSLARQGVSDASSRAGQPKASVSRAKHLASRQGRSTR